jgi:alpha-tubulin suppressor-like RCC1 family protein
MHLPTVLADGARRLTPVLVVAIVITVLGCREDPVSPTDPQHASPLATMAATSLAFQQLSVGGHHTCGATVGDRAYCWGANSFGNLGDGTAATRVSPVAVVGGRSLVQVSAGLTHTCGLTTEGRAYCWGENNSGQLGDGSGLGVSWTPVAVAGSRRFRRIRVGYNSTCASTLADVAFCWGGNNWGQLGDGTKTDRPTPVRVRGGHSFRQVVPGYQHTCGMTPTGKVYCWGDNTFRQLGDGTTAESRTLPAAVTGDLVFTQLSAGNLHTCGVTGTNIAYCWGRNADGQLGDGTVAQRAKPTMVARGLRFSGVDAGVQHTCGVSTTKVAWCWGNNTYAQLGDGSRTRRLAPVRVAGNLRFNAILTGERHSCGLTTGDAAYCWGENGSGQLGDGTRTARLTPVAVVGAS